MKFVIFVTEEMSVASFWVVVPFGGNCCLYLHI
jgi:hypothetical protein